jgi:hypothetical protein
MAQMSIVPSQPGVQPLAINLRSEQPLERDRLTAALRLIWVIPQAFVLFFVYIAAFFVAIAGWFGALFTGELPDFAEDFLGGVIRWSARVQGYYYFLTDVYPPFSTEEFAEYPVVIEIPPRAPLNRMAVLFRIILVIPAAIVGSVVGTGIGFISVASWAMITFTGALPIPLFEATRAVVRFQTRLAGYFWMITAEYPWGILGDATATRGAESTDGGDWSITLSEGGKYAMYVVIALGAVYVLYNYL